MKLQVISSQAGLPHEYQKIIRQI
jgi:hypothetical protein